MARSYIDPSLVAMAAQPAAPPWDWNPGATFLTAFNAAQENKRRNEEMALENELAQILLPAKKAEAEYNLKKFALDAQLLEKMHKTKSAALDASYRGITSAVGGGSSGSGSTVQGSGSSAQPSNQPRYRPFGTSAPQTSQEEMVTI